MTTFREALGQFLDNIKIAQSENTWRNYKSDLLGESGFLLLSAPALKPSTPISKLTENHAADYMQKLLSSGMAASTRQRRAAAIREFYKFVRARKWAEVSAEDLDYLLKAGKLLTGVKVSVHFDADKIQRILDYASGPQYANRHKALTAPADRLMVLRDRAFVLTLAETGLRVSEACGLLRGDVDWKKNVAKIVGKGNKQEHVRFGKKSLRAVKAYLAARAAQDGSSGPLGSLAIFSRHDKRAAGRTVKMGIDTAERIVHDLALEALGESDYDPSITCHKFRHFFINRVWDEKGDLKLAQEMGRHENIATTSKYTHLTDSKRDKAHAEIFDE